MSRLVVVSNRVAMPTDAKPASGGLAVGLLGALEESGGMWFGWSGDIVSGSNANAGPKIQRKDQVTYATVGLSRRDYDQYYRGFSNAMLWPVFHYRNDLARYDRQEYTGYRRVNNWLAQQLVPLLQPDDIIWVHDYHLLPFADALRAAGVVNRIGFFLHIPFPAPQILLTIPPHEDLIKSLCSYDLVGFQTETDLTAFCDYIEREAHGTVSADKQIQAYGHTLQAGVYRIGIFPDDVAAQARRPENRKPVLELKQSLAGRKLIMSVDRLDYSKGLVERFRAFERLLETTPTLQGGVAFVQIAPPSRSDVQTYQEIRERLEYEAGRINGRFSSLNYAPIRYLNRGFDHRMLMSLFRASDVGFVTPLRDGMNLVAKEYVAAQDPDDPGVLVLSCFAGAAAELSGALIVNPHDISGMAEALERALTMTLPLRQARHQENLEVLRRNNLGAWRESFLNDLRACPWLQGDAPDANLEASRAAPRAPLQLLPSSSVSL